MAGVVALASFSCMSFPRPLPASAIGLVPDEGKAGKPGGGSTEVGTPTPEVLAVVAVAAAMVAWLYARGLHRGVCGGGAEDLHLQ